MLTDLMTAGRDPAKASSGGPALASKAPPETGSVIPSDHNGRRGSPAAETDADDP